MGNVRALSKLPQGKAFSVLGVLALLFEKVTFTEKIQYCSIFLVISIGAFFQMFLSAVFQCLTVLKDVFHG